MSNHQYRFKRLFLPHVALHLDGIELVFKGINTHDEPLQFTAVVSWRWVSAFLRALRAFWRDVDRPSRLAEVELIDRITEGGDS